VLHSKCLFKSRKRCRSAMTTCYYRPHHTHFVDAAYCYRCIDVAWSVCWTHGWICKNGRTASEPAWGYTVDLCGSKEPCIRWGPDLTREGALFRSGDAAFCQVLLDTYYPLEVDHCQHAWCLHRVRSVDLLVSASVTVLRGHLTRAPDRRATDKWEMDKTE